MNSTEVNESMASLRKSLLAVEASRSTATAMLRVAAKSGPEIATQMGTMVATALEELHTELQAAGVTTAALITAVRTPAATPQPEPAKPAPKK